MERRNVLRSVAVALTAGVAGCGDGGDGDGGDGTPTDTRTATETAAATETPTATATATEEPTATATATETGPQVVTVGANGSLRFRPSSFTIAVGDTVRWEWEGDNHNVTPNEIPDASTWQGTTAEGPYTYDAGHTHSHTFEVAGEYSYYCDPHRSAGMTGSFTVTE